METHQKNFRARMPYYEALQVLQQQFKVDSTDIIHEALDNSPNEQFQKELTKRKEAYGRKHKQEEDKREAVRQEFSN